MRGAPLAFVLLLLAASAAGCTSEDGSEYLISGIHARYDAENHTATVRYAIIRVADEDANVAGLRTWSEVDHVEREGSGALHSDFSTVPLWASGEVRRYEGLHPSVVPPFRVVGLTPFENALDLRMVRGPCFDAESRPWHGCPKVSYEPDFIADTPEALEQLRACCDWQPLDVEPYDLACAWRGVLVTCNVEVWSYSNDTVRVLAAAAVDIGDGHPATTPIELEPIPAQGRLHAQFNLSAPADLVTMNLTGASVRLTLTHPEYARSQIAIASPVGIVDAPR